MSFGGLNVRDHLLIGVRCEKTSHAMKCKEMIGLKLELENCGKAKVFLVFFTLHLRYFFQIALQI